MTVKGSSFIIQNDGLPSLSFRGWTDIDGDTYFTKCHNLSCISFENRKVYNDDVKTVPYAIKAADGLPLIFISSDSSQGPLTILKCADSICRNTKSSSKQSIWPDHFMADN